MASSVKKLSKGEFHVEVEYGGRIYSDNVEPEGLLGLMENIGSDDKYYPIAEKMLKAINSFTKKSTKKTVGGLNETDNED